MTCAQAAREEQKHSELSRLIKLERTLKEIVKEQQEDEYLTGPTSSARDLYKLQELRRLHRAVEGEE